MDDTRTSWIKTKGLRVSIIALVILVGIVAFWLFTHSRISVEVAGSMDGSEVTYSFRNTSSGNTKKVVSSSTSTSTWVKRGSYEVTVSGGEGSFVEFVPSTPLFFNSTNISGQLTPERLRVHVGDGVKPCFGLGGSILVSGGCEGVYGNLSIHRPATKTTPTFITNNPDRTTYGENQALITSGETPTLIIKSSAFSDGDGEDRPDGPSIYTAIRFGETAKDVVLSELSGTDQYYFKDIGSGGFVAYQNNANKIYVYNSIGKKVVEFDLEKPQNQNLNFVSIDINSENGFASLYSTAADTDSKDAVSEVIVTHDSKSVHFKFENEAYQDIKLCGTHKICLVGSRVGMDVYDISGDKANYDFSASNVASISKVGDGKQMLLINDNGILNINVDNKQGYMEYSLGDYSFDEINLQNNGYVLRLTDNIGRVIGLFVDQSTADLDTIDKKRLQLQTLSDVSYVSVYRNYIYVAANIGEPEYNPETDRREYNEEKKKAVANTINTEIDRLGIDRNKYTITSNAF